MRQSFLIILTGLLLSLQSRGQSCWPNGVFLYSQADVDNFPSFYPGCTSIEGSLNIYFGKDITNLDSLSGITSIGGSVWITQDSLLTNLHGLENLTSIGGELNISSCHSLVNFQGLNQLSTIGGGWLIAYNPQLSSVDGLDGLTSIGADVYIGFNPLLSNLDGLSHLTAIGGDLYLAGDSSLVSVDGLSELTTIGLGLQFLELDSLRNLDGLNKLDSLGGELRIQYCPNLTSIAGFQQLKTIAGAFDCFVNTALTSISGLNQLTSLGDTIRIFGNSLLTEISGLNQLPAAKGVHLVANLQLTSLSGLQQLITVDSNLTIDGNFSLSDLSGLAQLVSVGGRLWVSLNHLETMTGFASLQTVHGNLFLNEPFALASLNGLQKLDSVGGTLELNTNRYLTDLSGLDNLKRVGGDLRLWAQDSSTSFTGLENLLSIGGTLNVAGGNPKLHDLSGLDNLKSVGQDVIIQNNWVLKSLHGLESLDSVGGRFMVAYNSLLSECAVAALCHQLLVSPDSVFIISNGTGCSYLAEVKAQCDIQPGQCLLNGISFESQAQVDDFPADYPGCKEILGSVYMMGADIKTLDSLSVLTGIGSNLTIVGTRLADLSGLENLDSIGGGLSIQGNDSLTDLHGLEQVTFSAGASLVIVHNPVLTSLSHLGTFPSLNSCTIGNNDALTDLQGLETVGSIASLLIVNNTSLASLSALGNIDILYSCDISYNTALAGLAGLEKVDSLPYLHIDGNPLISNLQGLDHLTKGEYCIVTNNAALTDLSGLDNLATATDIAITDNPALTSITALQNLTTVTQIRISGNTALPACAIPPVCSRLATNPDSVIIENNAPGCNDVFEVETLCGGTIVTVAVAYCQDSNWQFCGSAIPGEIVHFSASNQSIFRQTSATGTTQFSFLGTGSFALELPQVPADKWEIGEFVQLLTSSTGHDSINVQLLLSPLLHCPELTVDLGLPSFFRGCLVNSDLTVSVRNTGTVVAEGVKTAVVVPPTLQLLSATPPVDAQSGDTLFFNLGDLPPFGTATLQLTVKTDCNAFLIGQTLCLEAFASLDNPCPTTLPAFSEIKLATKCVGDTLVRFTIKNIGDAPTQNWHEYKLIRNDVVTNTNAFSLNAQQSMSIDLPADGATWRMEATKFDDGTQTATALENCGGLTPGLINAFWQDQGPLDYDFGCRRVVASYDPNQKSAVPTGAGGYHLLAANQPLQYTIDFQNTGTDTAFRVLLRDELPLGLNVNTFRPGYASHPYTWEIRGANTLEVLFSPITLPQSSVNEPASHGFFSFTIDQKPDLPNGTYLFNTAAIIFDFNPPIGTNYVQHMIGQLTVAVDEPQASAGLWQVWGNPTRDLATFHASEFIPGEKRFALFDGSGRPVRVAQFSEQSFGFQRDGLPAGLYFFKISDARGRAFAGKIVVSD
ncbi:MAG: hypothetical protein ABIQ93_04235 [Saprospiraceae bacterium]